MALEQIFSQLERLGVYDVLLPFVLIFTIVFAVLQKTRIFDDKRVNTMIALVMGLGVIFPHVLGYYPPGRDIVDIINQSLPQVSVVVVAILMAMIIVGVMGRKVELGNVSMSGWIALLSFAIILFIFGNAAGWWTRPGWLRAIDSPDIMALVIVILVFAIIIWFVTKEEGGGTHVSKEKVGDQLRDALLGGGRE